MPEVIWTIRWPDGREQACYSPSTILARHFRVGEAVPVPEFRTRARAALQAASDRVAAVHGHPCSRAAAQIAVLERMADAQPPGLVEILSMS